MDREHKAMDEIVAERAIGVAEVRASAGERERNRLAAIIPSLTGGEQWIEQSVESAVQRAADILWQARHLNRGPVDIAIMADATLNEVRAVVDGLAREVTLGDGVTVERIAYREWWGDELDSGIREGPMCHARGECSSLEEKDPMPGPRLKERRKEAQKLFSEGEIKIGQIAEKMGTSQPMARRYVGYGDKDMGGHSVLGGRTTPEYL